MWKTQQLFPHLSHRLGNLLPILNTEFVSVNDHVGASCSWNCCVAIKASTLQLPFSFLLFLQADPDVDISDLLKGYFVNIANQFQAPKTDTNEISGLLCLHQPPGLVKVSRVILVRKHASNLRNYSQQNGVCHPDSGKQTAHAFTLML